MLARVLFHDLILAIHRVLQSEFSLKECLAEETTISVPTVKGSLVLHIIELVQQSKLLTRKVIFILLIRSYCVGIIEVRNPVTAIEMLMADSLKFGRLRRLLKQLFLSSQLPFSLLELLLLVDIICT